MSSPQTELREAGFPAHAGMDPSIGHTPPIALVVSPPTRGWTRVALPVEDKRPGFPAHAGMDPLPCPTHAGLNMVSPPTRGWTPW